MLGTKFTKPLTDIEGYQKSAAWCNENGATIEDKGDYYEVVAIPAPTQEEINKQTQARLTSAVQNLLDTEAQKLGYDNCLSVCSYVDTGVTKFDNEGKAFRSWRSVVWSKCYEVLNAVLVGEREIPTEEELLAELPILEIVYSKE